MCRTDPYQMAPLIIFIRECNVDYAYFYTGVYEKMYWLQQKLTHYSIQTIVTTHTYICHCTVH